MIADVRIYTCKPNKMAEFVKIYEELGWPLPARRGWRRRCRKSGSTVC